MKTEVENMVDRVPSNGAWWSNSAREIFIGEADMLLAEGFEMPDIEDVLVKLYRAVASEFGE